jgi:hypothetical protein
VLRYDFSTREWKEGRADTEQAAIADARAAVEQMANGRPAFADYRVGTASARLKEVNVEKRKSRVSEAKGAGPVEYLYNRYDDKFQIVKKTTKRIYYILATDEDTPLFCKLENPIRYIDREQIEREGEIWTRENAHLFLKPPERHPLRDPAVADIRELKAAMGAAHPDAGGSNEAFIAARQAYVAVRRAQQTASVPLEETF